MNVLYKLPYLFWRDEEERSEKELEKVLKKEIGEDE